ncbi:MAG: transglutaminase domain-containing protein [Bacillota bacterium]
MGDHSGGENTSYVKLLAVHDWTAQSVYYNYDGYRLGDYGRTDTYGTLKDRMSVCHGYAILTETSLRSARILAKAKSGAGRFRGMAS